MMKEANKEQGMCMDDVELTLRRFATEQKDEALMKLLSSMFTETAEQKVKHETAKGDKMEDSKEKE